jgi:hypothetical protein
MRDCEYLNTCLFLKDTLEGMPACSDLYKRTYCKGGYQTCARFVVLQAIGRENVPGDLLPNDSARAQELVRS